MEEASGGEENAPFARVRRRRGQVVLRDGATASSGSLWLSIGSGIAECVESVPVCAIPLCNSRIYSVQTTNYK